VSVLSDHIQWQDWPAKGVVGLTNGGFMRCYRLMPPSLEHASDAARLGTANRASDQFRRLRDSYGLHFEEVFLPADGYSPKAEWPTLASAWLDAERERDCLSFGSQMESRHYLTVTSKPKGATRHWFQKFLFTGDNVATRDLDRDLAEFQRTCEDIQATLADAARLKPLTDNETASYLHFTATHNYQRWIRAENHPDIAKMLATEPFDPAWGVGKLGNNYVQFVALSGYDNGTKPQMLEDLDVRFPYRRVTRWLPVERGEARGMLRSRQLDAGMEEEGAREGLLKAFDKTHVARQSMADPQAAADAEAAKKAGGLLDRRGYGMMTATYVVWDESRSVCQDKVKALRKEIANAGLVAKSETLGTWGTWLGTLPGHLHSGSRKVPVTTRNLADLAPSTRKWPGEHHDRALEKATKLKRPIMYTADPHPFRLTFDQDGGSANLAIFGAMGSGKSVLLNHIALGHFAAPEMQVISLSVGRSELGPCILSGGAVYSIGAQKSLAFQPLAHVDRPEEMRFAAEWLELVLDSVGTKVTPEQREALQVSLASMAGKKPQIRTITELRKDLGSRAPELAAALKPFSHEGLYGHIFDGNDAAAIGWRRWTMFDIAALLQKTVPAWVVESALSLLLHLVRGRFNGQQTLLVCDEYPQYLHLSKLTGALKSTLETERKNHVRVLLAAQNPHQLHKHSDLAAVVQSACPVRIYGRDASAKDKVTATAYRDWSMSDEMVEAVTRLRQGHYFYYSPKGTREFDLRPGPIALTLTGMSSPDELKLISKLHAEHKDDTDRILAELLRARGLELKAKELEKWLKARTAA
jgi:type IV secretory pathway VirB4 component